MHKRLCLASMVAAAAGSAVLAMAVPAASEPPAQWGDGPPPPHGHLLLNGVVLDEDGPVSAKGCRALANGEVVPRSAHHANLHTGQAGRAQIGAGNQVLPTHPALPWGDTCESVMAYFFPS